jgi:hypothetical protein
MLITYQTSQIRTAFFKEANLSFFSGTNSGATYPLNPVAFIARMIAG